MPVICSAGNFSLRIRTQLVQLSLNSSKEVCFCVFIRMCCICVCLQERAIKGAVWWRDCIKGAREETEWQAAERAACGGGRGNDAGA